MSERKKEWQGIYGGAAAEAVVPGHAVAGSAFEPKMPQPDTVRRELDQISRQLKGLSDRVKRLKDTA